MTPRRHGVALLESLIAMSIVAIAGLALLSLATEAMKRTSDAQAADNESREASAFLDAVSLWTRTELEQRVGTRPQGRFALTVQRPGPSRFHLSLADSARSRELLTTMLYRPDHAATQP